MSDDINQEILRELHILRRTNQFATYFALILAVAGVVFLAWVQLKRERSDEAARQARSSAQATQARRSAQDSQEAVWPSIEAALDRGDNQKALSIAQGFVARQPKYYFSHASLGAVYVATGDFTNAEAAYVRAVELYPSEELEKTLAAVRKRLARDRAAPGQTR